ncbi:hypothetical protein CLV24_1574 [Pontibacter ummariensis]|uniref:Uncharacterized protein n=1 Tax=Pontibacter ummariensis TaxID=1610492 RepID=A0A239LZH3_9BACT|nr:hypothetical protein [Pontibacter ummariensis]PRY00207.1 hypothetical protein CLV24_1574 [Pontibacter ummariensis]SNT35054.1 hypothetical protein SAMN06296052_1574 [Pontibacter ummariensis]
MRTLTFNFHNEQEEKVLLAFLDSLKYDYRRVDEPEDFRLSEEEVKGLLQTKRDFVEGRTTARPWEDIKRDLRRA